MVGSAPRCPDNHFRNLPGFACNPVYSHNRKGFEGLRLPNFDAGPSDADHGFPCLHGETTWCYLDSLVLPVFTAAGHRAVAPADFGFGRSDKAAPWADRRQSRKGVPCNGSATS